MAEFLGSMIYPFLVCLVLAGIHVYLGIHVITRKVIFVDLALAQIAALGVVYGVLLGYNLRENPWAIKGFSLAFAFVGAAIFSLTRMRRERVPQEAIIGITYAVSLAATILASAHLPHGADEVRELLSGSILWVRGDTILYTALLYAGIGAFHYVFRRRFLLISLDPEQAEAEGINIRLWDFLFYISFGVVVTNAVAIAGVLLVFSYLVIPAVVAVLFADRIGTRLIIGWGIGTLVSFAGVAISYAKDLPSGPTIVVGFAVVLIVAAVIHFIAYSTPRGSQVFKVLAGGIAVALFISATVLLQKDEEHDLFDRVKSPIKNERLAALRILKDDSHLWEQSSSLVPDLLGDSEAEVRSATLDLIVLYGDDSHLAAVHARLMDPDDIVRESALRCVRSMESSSSVKPLLEAIAVEDDEYLKVEMAHALLEMGDPRGIPILIAMMDNSELRGVRKDAHEHLSVHAPVKFPFDANADADVNDREIEALHRWWFEHGDDLQWQQGTKVFEPKKQD
jgi:zinc/manganese transport system permease protein